MHDNGQGSSHSTSRYLPGATLDAKSGRCSHEQPHLQLATLDFAFCGLATGHSATFVRASRRFRESGNGSRVSICCDQWLLSRAVNVDGAWLCLSRFPFSGRLFPDLRMTNGIPTFPLVFCCFPSPHTTTLHSHTWAAPPTTAGRLVSLLASQTLPLPLRPHCTWWLFFSCMITTGLAFWNFWCVLMMHCSELFVLDPGLLGWVRLGHAVSRLSEIPHSPFVPQSLSCFVLLNRCTSMTGYSIKHVA